jgi:hypothetical protein
MSETFIYDRMHVVWLAAASKPSGGNNSSSMGQADTSSKAWYHTCRSVAAHVHLETISQAVKPALILRPAWQPAEYCCGWEHKWAVHVV